MKMAWRMFVSWLVKSLICMFFLFGVGILSYKAVMHFFHIPEVQPMVSLGSVTGQKDITTATIDDISKNLIFCVDDKNGDISKLILEIFNCADHKLYYITIPARTQFTMSDILYRELVLVDPAIPQVIKLSGIKNYFPKDKVYEYGVLLLEDLLDMKLSYYTVMPESVYNSVFITDTSETSKEIFSGEYKEFLKKLTTEKQVTDYLEELYDTIDSNLSVTDKQKYVESYLELTLEDISFELIAGNQTNSAFIVDTAGVAKQLAAKIGVQPLN
jgi:hypothetical protein